MKNYFHDGNSPESLKAPCAAMSLPFIQAIVRNADLAMPSCQSQHALSYN